MLAWTSAVGLYSAIPPLDYGDLAEAMLAKSHYYYRQD
jgi:hypothetical protein